jgi:hypothetical protein
LRGDPGARMRAVVDPGGALARVTSHDPHFKPTI